MTPYFLQKFDTYDEAVAFQHERLCWCIQRGHAIREATLDGERDFDTKKVRWVAFVRAFPLVIAIDTSGMLGVMWDDTDR